MGISRQSHILIIEVVTSAIFRLFYFDLESVADQTAPDLTTTSCSICVTFISYLLHVLRVTKPLLLKRVEFANNFLSRQGCL